jgi:hypothetical protein
VILQLTPTCAAGVTVEFAPSSVVAVSSEAHTRDGKLAAIYVRARKPGTVRIIVTRPRADRTIIVGHVT